MRWTVPIAAAAIAALALPAAPAAAAPDGALAVAAARVTSGQPITFTYSTPRPDPKNWIGLYTDPGDGPAEEKYVGPSLRWVYIPQSSGTATLPTDGLEPGDYVAYALAKDGYAWLSAPVKVKIVSNEPPRFVTGTFTLRNARAGSPYAASVKGLARGRTESFAKVSGPAWAQVGADGSVTGTPPASASAKTAVLTVEARGADGERATATVRVRVRPPGAPLVPELKALSWNLWHGGSQVRNGREKQLRFLLEQDVDVVGVQESSGVAVRELGEALGWDYYQAGADVGILSRYPITARGPEPSASGLPVSNVRVRLDERRGTELAVWNAHLGYTPYGPYDACFGKMPVERLLEREAQSKRTGQIEGIMRAMAPELEAAGRSPVLLMGDFNAPSHLDWTDANRRCGHGAVPWPTSTAPAAAGMLDTYRVAHPDPAADPGITWSPIYKTFTGGYGHDSHAGEPEPQDRIDFIHAKGDLSVLSSEAVVEGTPRPIPGHQDNAWTSDHAAVLTVFKVG